MSERFTPEEQFLRDQAAQAIREFRERERRHGHEKKRDLTYGRGIVEYTDILMGLQHFISYVRSLSFGKVKMLDIGAGHGKAMGELENIEDLSYNLEIIGTTLTKNKKTERNLGNEKIILTPAETLKPIKDSEISGIISVHGVGHSKSPELVADSIYRVLVPSGAFKTTYVDFENGEGWYKEFTEMHQRLIDRLTSLGFDVALYKNPTKTLAGQDAIAVVLAAIKPPVVGITAQKLLSLDFADYEEQKEHLQSQVQKTDDDSEEPEELFDEEEDKEDLIRYIESQL